MNTEPVPQICHLGQTLGTASLADKQGPQSLVSTLGSNHSGAVLSQIYNSNGLLDSPIFPSLGNHFSLVSFGIPPYLIVQPKCHPFHEAV